MNRSHLSAAVATLLAAAVCYVSPLAAQAQTRTGKTKEETYIVIQIKDEKVEYKAIATSGLKDEKKHISDDYKTRLKEWRDARKTDPKAAQPVVPVVKQMPGGTFQTQKGAQDYADKLNKEVEDATAKKDDKAK